MKLIDFMQLGPGHTLLGMLVMVVVTVIWFLVTGDFHLSLWVAYTAQSAWWFSRERRDYEIKIKIDPHSEWYKGWNFFLWTQNDLWVPIVINGISTFLITRFF